MVHCRLVDLKMWAELFDVRGVEANIAKVHGIASQIARHVYPKNMVKELH